MSTNSPEPTAHRHFIKLGIDYFVAARFSVLGNLLGVSGNLYHHAIEMILKSELSKSKPLEELKKLGHRLIANWNEFKLLCPGEDLTQFDSLIAGLDQFESIRYPDKMIGANMVLSISWQSNPAPVFTAESLARFRQFNLVIPDIDRLFDRVFNLCAIDTRYWMSNLNANSLGALCFQNAFAQGWLTEKAPAQNGNQGQGMAAALEQLATSQALAHIPDPATWESEVREDRPLPGRE